MLYITRKENESVFINDAIEVVVSKISKGQVKIGFKIHDEKAPHQIYRKELYMKIKNENKDAIQIAPEDLQFLVSDVVNAMRKEDQNE